MTDPRHPRLSFSFLYFGPRVLDRHAHAFASLEQYGYGGAELPVAMATDSELQAIRQRLSEHGLRASAVGLLGDGENPIDETSGVRERAVDRLRELLDRAATLGADTLAGPLHSAYGRFTNRPPSLMEFARCVDVMQRVGEHASAVGVRIALEPLNRFECYFVNTIGSVDRLVRAIAHPMVVAAIDTHHAHIEEDDVERAIADAGTSIGHVQLSENHRGVPGRGQVDFRSILRALDRIGYAGWLVIEAFSRQDPEFGSALRIWRELDSGLDDVLAAGPRLFSEAR